MNCGPRYLVMLLLFRELQSICPLGISLCAGLAIQRAGRYCWRSQPSSSGQPWSASAMLSRPGASLNHRFEARWIWYVLNLQLALPIYWFTNWLMSYDTRTNIYAQSGELVASAFSSSGITPAECTLEDGGNQTYVLRIQPVVVGRHQLDIRFNNVPIPGIYNLQYEYIPV